MLPRGLAAASHPINGSNTCLDSLAALTVAGADKTSAPLPLSFPPVDASSGLLVTESRRSLARDAKSGVDALCCESPADCFGIARHRPQLWIGPCRISGKHNATFSDLSLSYKVSVFFQTGRR